MTPAEFARRHPRLYHVTDPAAWPGIEARGLLPAQRLVELFGHPDPEAVLRTRRPAEVRLTHPTLGEAVVNDNLPLNVASLDKALDDGLTVADWMGMLSARVFFWADRRAADRLLNARMNRGRSRLVIEVDTRSLAEAHAGRLELSPINSGSSIRRAARRGLGTYTPVTAMSYDAWRRKRGRLDRVLEVTAVGGVPDLADHVLGREVVTPSGT